MEDWKQFFKNFIANNYFVTRIHNPGEVSSPIVKAIKDKEIPTVDPDEISKPIIDAIEKMQKNTSREVTLNGVDVVAIKGEKGDSPTNDEIVELIKPLIPEPKKGDKGDIGLS